MRAACLYLSPTLVSKLKIHSEQQQQQQNPDEIK